MAFTDNQITLVIALCASAMSVISPLATMMVSGRVAKSSKQDDWARQDAVAAAAAAASKELLDLNKTNAEKAADAAQALLNLNAKTAAEAAETARQAAARSIHIQQLSEATHAYVNSNYTTSIEATLAATTSQLWALRVAARGNGADALEAEALIPGTVETIGKLQEQLTERKKASVIAGSSVVAVVSARAPV